MICRSSNVSKSNAAICASTKLPELSRVNAAAVIAG
jgi:hypothetical protein